MSPTLELEEAVKARDATPKLLVKWSSRWEEFVGSIKPALTRSEARLAGEAPFGLIPLRIMVPSYVLEAFLIAAAIFAEGEDRRIAAVCGAQNLQPRCDLLQRRRAATHPGSRRR